MSSQKTYRPFLFGVYTPNTMSKVYFEENAVFQTFLSEDL